MVIYLTLPMPPSLNNFRVPNKYGKGSHLSKEANTFKKDCPKIIRDQIGRIDLLICPISLTMHFYRGRRVGDISNLIKLAEDALTGTIFVDDEQVAHLDIHKHDHDHLNPRVEIEIREMVERPTNYVLKDEMRWRADDLLIASAVRKIGGVTVDWYRRGSMSALLPHIRGRSGKRMDDDPMDYHERWMGTRYEPAVLTEHATDEDKKLFGVKAPGKGKKR